MPSEYKMGKNPCTGKMNLEKMIQTDKRDYFQILLDDRLFLQWLLRPTDELGMYWKQKMEQDNAIKEAIDEMKPIITGIKVKEEGLSDEDRKAIWQKVEAALHHRGGIVEKPDAKKFHLNRFFRYAAAIALLIAAGAYWYFNQDTPSKPIDYTSLINQNGENLSEHVVIILENKDKIEIEEKETELIHDTEGRLSVNSKIVWEKDKNKTVKQKQAEETVMNQVHVPYGKTSSLIMSDGTKIWINSGTRLVYPVTFAAERREIYVEGEIYLEVAKNETVPFVVKTDRLEISVLGTSFNVSAYKNDQTQTIVLASGSVSVNDAKTTSELKPNQLFSYDKNAQTGAIKEVDVLDHICWKYGFLVFKRQPLIEVLKKVERYYNVQIDYSLLKNDHTSLSGKLDLKETVEETFRVISLTAPIRYDIQRDKIKISINP